MFEIKAKTVCNHKTRKAITGKKQHFDFNAKKKKDVPVQWLTRKDPNCQIEILWRVVSMESSYHGNQRDFYNYPSECNW